MKNQIFLRPMSASPRDLIALMVLFILLAGMTGPLPACAQQPADVASQSIPLQRVEAVFTGDLPEILQGRRFVRVLVSYNLTGFFIDRGRPRGLEYELLHRYEAFLNQQSKKVPPKSSWSSGSCRSISCCRR